LNQVHRLLGAIGVIVCFAVGDIAQGATYYVSKSGNDGISCSQAQSLTTPMATINRGIRCLAAGDTLYVRGGTYAEALASPAMASGSSWANPVRIAAYPSESVWMKPPVGTRYIIYLVSQSYVEFDGINLDASSATSTNRMGNLVVNWNSDSDYSHHIRYKNAEIIGYRAAGDLQTSDQLVNLAATPNGSGGYNEILNVKMHGSGGPNGNDGFYIHSSNNIVDGCDVYDVGFIGLQIYDGYNTPIGNIIRNNRIHDITQGMDERRGGLVVAGNNTVIYNNLVYNINANGTYSSGGQSAISVFSGNGNQIYNNTIVNNRATAIEINGVSNTQVSNNIVYGNSAAITNGGSGTTLNTNLLGIDAQFVNPVGGDFHLKSGSPAIDSGTSLTSVTADIAGTPRPQGKTFDIGAYEYSSTTQTQAPAAPTGVRIVSN
jgi:parallel beta-helix repeat protein